MYDDLVRGLRAASWRVIPELRELAQAAEETFARFQKSPRNASSRQRLDALINNSDAAIDLMFAHLKYHILSHDEPLSIKDTLTAMNVLATLRRTYQAIQQQVGGEPIDVRVEEKVVTNIPG